MMTLRELGVIEAALVKTLASPSKIVRFTDMLLTQSRPPDKSELRDLMKTINNAKLEVRNWLRKLDKNERYLVLILALFDDLPEQDFWTIYDKLIEILRKRDATLPLLDYYALIPVKPL